MSNWQQNYNKTTQPSQGWKTPSRSSPQGGGVRGCLCKDTLTYSRKCCDGSLMAQGIGNITRSPNEYTVYSQVINFSVPYPNSCRYICDAVIQDVQYGINCTNMGDLINMLNANPPVQPNGEFYLYGYYVDNGDGRVALQMNEEVFNLFCPGGVVTLDIFND